MISHAYTGQNVSVDSEHCQYQRPSHLSVESMVAWSKQAEAVSERQV